MAPPALTPDLIPPPVVEVCARLREKGHRAWVVGGCVRDLLMGRPVSDWDICTSAKPKQTQRAFRKVIPTGIQHGTVTVLWKGEGYEVTTLRGEGEYTDGRRPDEVFFVDDIREDLARRDFTVNAIAYDPIADRLEDPFEGMADLEAGKIRAVGVPAERFAEDGLRILRGARFVATLGFELEADTRAAFFGALDTYAKVSAERIREEWVKTMKARAPSAAFRIMRETGILERTCPLLLATADAPVGARSAWAVSLDALDASRPPPEERLAALLHAVGRPRADEGTFARIGADLLEGWLRELRFSNDERKLITHLVRLHRVDGAAGWSDAEVRRFLQRAGRERVHAVLRLARAVRQAEAGDVAEVDHLKARVEAALLEQVPLTVGELAVNGKDAMDALGGGGRAVGELLRELLDRVVDDPALNEREPLLALLHELAAARKEAS